jgi:hypothetical protein
MLKVRFQSSFFGCLPLSVYFGICALLPNYWTCLDFLPSFSLGMWTCTTLNLCYRCAKTKKSCVNCCQASR